MNELAFDTPYNYKSSFKYSFYFLPKEERNAINCIYLFCRYVDDIVDNNPITDLNDKNRIQEKKILLNKVRNEVDNCYKNTPQNPAFKPLVAVIQRYRIPKQYFMILIDGVETDLIRNRYKTFEELRDYCYGVASIVGLMCLEIFGYKYEQTKEYAVNLGIALQLTNIIRDVWEDAQLNRIYIPTEDLQHFNYSENDLFAKNYNNNFVELMRYQARRAREYFGKAHAALHSDERQNVFTAEIMDAIYYRLLEKIELREFNIFAGNRIKVRTTHKLWIAFKLWVINKFLTNRRTI